MFGRACLAAGPPAFFATVLVVQFASACELSSSPPHETGVVRRDSTGVEIVENLAPDRLAGSFWTIDPEPEIVIGGHEQTASTASDSAHLVWQVSGLARLEDGRVAVLSAGNRQLAIFTPSGELVRMIGRAGRGPGEFTRPDYLQYLPPDTLAVWDTWFNPVAYFDLEGNLLKHRSLDLGLIIEQTGGTAESPRHPLPDGSFVVRATRGDPDFRPTPGSVYRGSPTDFLRVDSSYATHHLGAWLLWEMWYPGPDISASPFPYYYVLNSHVADGGDPLVIYVSEGDRNEIHQFAPDGTLLRIIRRLTDPVPLTDRSRQAWLQAAGEGEDPTILEMQPVRESYPPVGALVVDTEGYLWVREWSASESGMPDQWSVFSPDGRWLGIIPGAPLDFLPCMPHGSPCWIDSDFFLTVLRDELGVERVEGYRIRRDDPLPATARDSEESDAYSH